ncbi:MAG TPA: DUF2085 domain-containing protein [Balneolaceae bacterium]|nr:DUF2085 domain-containing protein [Balneolaceae bacterium]
MKNKPLYIFVLFLSTLLVIIALGGGLWGQSSPWIMQWQHQLFYSLCHQLPERSFWINGQPMAVCARCFGIYTGFWSGLISALFIGNGIKKTVLKKILIVVLLLNIVDVAGNFLNIWQNTLFSRFALGFSLAAAAGILLGKAFVKRSILINQKQYGTSRSIERS